MVVKRVFQFVFPFYMKRSLKALPDFPRMENLTITFINRLRKNEERERREVNSLKRRDETGRENKKSSTANDKENSHSNNVSRRSPSFEKEDNDRCTCRPFLISILFSLFPLELPCFSLYQTFPRNLDIIYLHYSFRDQLRSRYPFVRSLLPFQYF